jgi:hypothetical protein
MFKIYQKTGIVLGIGAVLLWGSIQFVYIAQLSKVKHLKMSLESNKQRNVRIDELGKDKDFFTNLMEKIEAYHQEVKSLLPKEIKLSGLLRELSVLGKKNDVTLLSIRPLESPNLEPVVMNENEPIDQLEPVEQAEMPFLNSDIEIILECHYENLGRYVQAVENNTLTVMAIKDIHITADEKSDDISRLKVILLIEAFYKGG